jgi:hypothetical protein
MPIVILDTLDLETAMPYKYLYSFDPRNVKCFGMIKDLDISSNPHKECDDGCGSSSRGFHLVDQYLITFIHGGGF